MNKPTITPCVVSRAADADAALQEYIEADLDLSMLGEAALREIASWTGTGQKGSWQQEQGESSRHSERLRDLFNERDDALGDMEAAGEAPWQVRWERST